MGNFQRMQEINIKGEHRTHVVSKCRIWCRFFEYHNKRFNIMILWLRMHFILRNHFFHTKKTEMGVLSGISVNEFPFRCTK